MNIRTALFAVSALSSTIMIVPAHAAEAKKDRLTAWEASRKHDDSDMVTTGVARGRDRLDSATSTSSIKDAEITKIGAPSLAELYRNIPGIRSEASTGLGSADYTIRGLPMVSAGAKYLQLQEDGLPVLEFGDILALTPDIFIRPDNNIAQVESIRGGSASTFASNAPGGVINLISQTGEVDGGSLQLSGGIDNELYRTDFEYGGHINDTLRFHFGGYYRQGDGPTRASVNANHGGQVKFNVTKDFSGGYIRLSGKYMDERNMVYVGSPLKVTGTDSNPHYQNVTNFSILRDTLVSRNLTPIDGFDGNNNLTTFDMRDGMHFLAKSIGLDSKFTLGEWSLSARARYSDQSGGGSTLVPLAAFQAAAFAGPGSLVYASGPMKGQTIADPTTLNGNGLLGLSAIYSQNIRSLNNFTGDARLSRVWNMDGGELTGTVGLYKSIQDIKIDLNFASFLHDINGNESAYVDFVAPGNTLITQGGVLDYRGPTPGNFKVENIKYGIWAPYGSLNFRKGKVSVGGSVRWDNGTVRGSNRTNGSTYTQTVDINNDGVITPAEMTFAYAPLSSTTPVHYNYDYVSYSGSINYRVSEVFSTFARYSKGARAGADHILLTPAINATDGSLADRSAAYDPVKQAEVGIKYRNNGVFVNVTGFYAKVSETNTQVGPDPVTGLLNLLIVKRSNRAYGAEFEGGVRSGPFSVTASATLTDAKITASEKPATVGKRPRHQAPFIYQIMPQYDTDLFTIGANVIGTTASYAQDENLLKMPAYTTVSAFLQVRPAERVQLSLNANNIFNVKAITDVSAATLGDPTVIGAGNVTFGQTLYGRNITGSVRFYF